MAFTRAAIRARGVGRAFGQSLHFFGHHGEAAACVAGRGRLDGRVQSQHVGLLGNVRDQFRDLANFLRRLAQALDALRRFLDLIANGVHTLAVVLHGALALLGGITRFAGHAGHVFGLGRHLVDSAGHLQHGVTGGTNFTELFGRGGQQFGRGLVDLAGGFRHASGRGLHLTHEVAQLFHGVVHRVGDGASDVFRHRGLLRQVAFGHCLQFVHQAKNGGLVRVVHALGFQFLRLGLAALLFGQLGAALLTRDVEAEQAVTPVKQSTHRNQQQQALPPRQAAGFVQLLAHIVQALAQRLRLFQDVVGSFTRRHQAAQVVQHRVGELSGAFEVDQQLLQVFHGPSRRVRGAGSVRGLPFSKPSAMALKAFRSLPNKNTASVLTPSLVKNSLALLPMRCVSITS